MLCCLRGHLWYFCPSPCYSRYCSSKLSAVWRANRPLGRRVSKAELITCTFPCDLQITAALSQWEKQKQSGEEKLKSSASIWRFSWTSHTQTDPVPLPQSQWQCPTEPCWAAALSPGAVNSPGRVPKPVKLSSNVTIALTRQSLTLTDKDCKFFRYYRNIDTKNMFIPDCGSAGQGGNGNSNLRASFLWPCKGICAAEPTVYWFFHISFFLSLTSLEITWSFQVRVIGLGRDKMEETHFRIFVC